MIEAAKEFGGVRFLFKTAYVGRTALTVWIVRMLHNSFSVNGLWGISYMHLE
jgi:hypothetical protein